MVRLPSATGLGGRSPFRMPAASKYSKVDSLPGPTGLKHLAVDAFEKLNSRGCRAVTRAEAKTALSTPVSAGYTKLTYAPSKTEPLTKEQVKEMPGVTAPLGLFDP